MWKKYKAIFFDWDGTAVISRKAPVDVVAARMKCLLQKGVKLAVISGTTIGNIGGGRLHEHFSVEERQNLFYGLGRGAYNYGFDQKGDPVLLSHKIPEKKELLLIHRICYEIHEHLLEQFNFPTDIVFTRPNYCKIDLMVDNSRGDQLFFQENELEGLKRDLESHGFTGGPAGLVKLAEDIGAKYGLPLSATSDAKYLEVGVSSKSDNVDALLVRFGDSGITAGDCSFWGDEYIGLDAGMFGSDSFMLTKHTRAGDFFDVSIAGGERPEGVRVLGGGVNTFLNFLEEESL